MPHTFTPNALPVLVGSFPLRDHSEAMNLTIRYTPEILSWPQLPAHKEEGMLAQFIPGLPGIVVSNGKIFLDDEGEAFHSDMVGFYEEYLAVTEGTADLIRSRFSLKADTAGGFFALLEAIRTRKEPLLAVKGQVTGPVTFTTALNNRKGIPIFYDLQLRDAAVKLLTLKARWQIRKLRDCGVPVIIFIDEPGMAGFGSSEFTSISREAVSQCFKEMIDGIQAEGGIAGIHVCANTDWSLILSLPFDIVNFDAYAYFDRLILYTQEVKRFLESGGILAWGIVPTLSTEALRKETVESLAVMWEAGIRRITDIGVDRNTAIRQSLITPSCGMGALPLDLATKVLIMTHELSMKIRSGFTHP